VVLEKEAHRAEFAKEYCADQVFVNPPRQSPGESTGSHSDRVSKHILDNMEGLYRGFDVCIEASGKEECMQMGIKVCRPGGMYVQVGNYDPSKHPQIPMSDVASKVLTVRGISITPS
jgi:D-xylulose reductase